MLLTMQVYLARWRGRGLNAILYLQAGRKHITRCTHMKRTLGAILDILAMQSRVCYFRCRHSSFELQPSLSNTCAEWCES